MIRYKVAYVDDENSLLEIGKAFLEQDPEIAVFVSNSPEEILRIVSEHNPYDVIISDYQMPSMDGIELLKRIRRGSENELPFIIFTGKSREEIAIEAINNGASFYMQKGGEIKSQYAELIHKTKQAVNKYRLKKVLDHFEELTSKILEAGGTLEENMSSVLNILNELLILDCSCITLNNGNEFVLSVTQGNIDVKIFEKNPVYKELGESAIINKKRYVLLQESIKREESGSHFISVLTMPIHFKEENLGIIYSFSSKPEFFNEERIRAVTLAKNLISIIIKLSRL